VVASKRELMRDLMCTWVDAVPSGCVLSHLDRYEASPTRSRSFIASPTDEGLSGGTRLLIVGVAESHSHPSRIYSRFASDCRKFALYNVWVRGQIKISCPSQVSSYKYLHQQNVNQQRHSLQIPVATPSGRSQSGYEEVRARE
jgi:hypothetical protein